MPPKLTLLAQKSLPNRTQLKTHAPASRSGSATAKTSATDRMDVSQRTATRSRATSASAASRSASGGSPIRRRPSSIVSATATGTHPSASLPASTGAALSAPKLRFSLLNSPGGQSSRSSACTPSPSCADAGANAESATVPPSSAARAARHRTSGSSVVSTSSSQPVTALSCGDVDSSHGGGAGVVTDPSTLASPKGHPFPLRPVSSRRLPLTSPHASLESTVASQGRGLAEVGAPLPHASTRGARAARPPVDDEDDIRSGAGGVPPVATPPPSPPSPPLRVPSYPLSPPDDEAKAGESLTFDAMGGADVDDEEANAPKGEPLILVDTTGHSPIPPQLQRRVAQEQRRERERIRRRLHPSARTLRLSARLRTTEPSARRSSSSTQDGPPADLMPTLHGERFLEQAIDQPSPRSGARTSTPGAVIACPQPEKAVPQPAAYPARVVGLTCQPITDVTARIEVDNLDGEEPEPTAPAPTAAAAAHTQGDREASGSGPRRIPKSRPPRSDSITTATTSTSQTSTPNRSLSRQTTSMLGSGPRPSTAVPVAYGQQTATGTRLPLSPPQPESQKANEEPEPRAEVAQPRPVASSGPRTVTKQPEDYQAQALHGNTAPPGQKHTTNTTTTTTETVSKTPTPSSSLGVKMRLKPGATMTRLKREGTAEAPRSPPTATPSTVRVMKAPDSIIQAANVAHGSPLQSVGCVPSISAGQDLLPPLCAADKHRTLTIVFDLDETLCNNRTLGPALLRPGVLAMLDDLRSLSPSPRYMSAEEAAASGKAVSATTRLYEQAVARQMGCGLSSSSGALSGRASCRNSVSPPAVPPTTALHAPSWTNAEYDVGPRVELVVWTASVESVARTVLVRLDPDGVIFDQCVFRDPRWYREVAYTKDLRRLGRDMAHVTIVENAPSAVALNRSHAILVNDFVSSRSDRQLYGVRTVLREWIELARHSAQLPPRPIGSTDADLTATLVNEYRKRNEAAPTHVPASPDATESPATITASQRCTSMVNVRSSRGSDPASSACSPERADSGLAIAPITRFLAQHPFVTKATGYIDVMSMRHIMQLYKDEVPRRRERLSRGSVSRSGSHGGVAPGVARPTPIATSKAAKAALKKKTTVTVSVMASSTVTLPGNLTPAPGAKKPSPDATPMATSSMTNSKTKRRADANHATTPPPPAAPTSASVNGSVAGGAPTSTERKGTTTPSPATTAWTAPLPKTAAQKGNAGVTTTMTGSHTRITKRASKPGWIG